MAQAPMSKEERKLLVKEWQKSGLSQKKFSEVKGLKVPTFSKWIEKAQEEEHAKETR